MNTGLGKVGRFRSLVVLSLVGLVLLASAGAAPSRRDSVGVIVQAESMEEAAAEVRQVGGQVSHELGAVSYTHLTLPTTPYV